MSAAPPDIMIFAAGFGTRMRPLTDTRPKPLIKVAGRTLLARALELAAPSDLPVTVNAHYMSEQIAEHLKDRTNTRIIFECPDILDTGVPTRSRHCARRGVQTRWMPCCC